MPEPKRKPTGSELLSAGGGLLMAASFWLPMVGSAPRSPMRMLASSVSTLARAPGRRDTVVNDLGVPLLIVLPHLFGVLILVAAAVPSLGGRRSMRRGQTVGAVLCLVWFGFWAMMGDWIEAQYGLYLALLAASAMLVAPIYAVSVAASDTGPQP